MGHEPLGRVLALCAGVLSPNVAGAVAGVAYAELRMHPTAPGETGIRIEFEDGSVMWLVAEED